MLNIILYIPNIKPKLRLIEKIDEIIDYLNEDELDLLKEITKIFQILENKIKGIKNE